MNNTVTIPTSELEGAALDWAVFCSVYPGLEPTIRVIEAQTVGRKPFIKPLTFPRAVYLTYSGAYEAECDWSPSTDWSQGGELIHKYMFDFEWVVSDWHGEPIEKFCVAHGYGLDREGLGPTHLIAACRAIVAAHLGDSVQVPAELVGGGMSRWDELEKAANAALGKEWKRDRTFGQLNIQDDNFMLGDNDAIFITAANPKTVLTLIEQNKRMRQALLELRNHSSVTAHQIEAIDAAIGEDQ